VTSLYFYPKSLSLNEKIVQVTLIYLPRLCAIGCGSWAGSAKRRVWPAAG